MTCPATPCTERYACTGCTASRLHSSHSCSSCSTCTSCTIYAPHTPAQTPARRLPSLRSAYSPCSQLHSHSTSNSNLSMDSNLSMHPNHSMHSPHSTHSCPCPHHPDAHPHDASPPCPHDASHTRVPDPDRDHDAPALRLERAVEHLERLVDVDIDVALDIDNIDIDIPTTPVSLAHAHTPTSKPKSRPGTKRSAANLRLHLTPRSPSPRPAARASQPPPHLHLAHQAHPHPQAHPGAHPQAPLLHQHDGPRRQRAVSTSTLYTPTPTASFFPQRIRTMTTHTAPRGTGSDSSKRHSQSGVGLGHPSMSPAPPSSMPPPSMTPMRAPSAVGSGLGSSAGHRREPSGRRTSVVSVGLGHVREPSYREYSGYTPTPAYTPAYSHTREGSQARAREPSTSRRPSVYSSTQPLPIPPARRNSTYGYSFRREPPPPPPPIVDDKFWTEGDFEIVSADGVRFRVPSYYLFAASAVFREAGVLDADPARDDIEMLSGMDDIDGIDSIDGVEEQSPRSPRVLPGVVHARFLRLSEPTETAPVLRIFLAFASTGHLPIPDDGTTLDSLELLRALVLFLRKYECDGTLSLALTVLREAVRMPSSISPLAAFVAGASAGDAFTCSVALDVTDWTWRMMDRHDLPAAPDANVFDPHHMPVAVWQLIPPMYTWALTTAWSGDSSSVRRRRDEDDEYDDEAARRSAVGSRCGSTLGRRVHAWQQWL